MGVLEGFFRRGVAYPHQLAAIIDNPLRSLWLSPRAHADRLRLEGGERALEIGPGSGFYSREIAKRLADRGELILLDVSPEMLDKARAKLERRGIARGVTYLPGDATRLPFEGQLDLVYMVTVLGEIPDPSACIASIRRALLPGGRLAITEQWPDPDYEPIEKLRALVEAEGFAFERREGPWWSYTAAFTAS